jgi:hypothetical protein
MSKVYHTLNQVTPTFLHTLSSSFLVVLHLQSLIVSLKMKVTRFSDMSVASRKQSFVCCYLFPACFLLGLLFNPEDGGNMFRQNLGVISQ